MWRAAPTVLHCSRQVCLHRKLEKLNGLWTCASTYALNSCNFHSKHICQSGTLAHRSVFLNCNLPGISSHAVILTPGLFSVHPGILCMQTKLFSNTTCHYGDKSQGKKGSKKEVGAKEKDQQFVRIYTFPYIVHCMAFSQSKILMTAFAVFSVPLTAYQYFSVETVPSQWLAIVSASSVLSCVTLYFMSYFIRRIVGKISVHKTEDLVEVSHLTFWGRKNDLYFKMDEITPLTDIQSRHDGYENFETFNSTVQPMHLYLKFGGVVDVKKMEHIFGILPYYWKSVQADPEKEDAKSNDRTILQQEREDRKEQNKYKENEQLQSESKVESQLHETQTRSKPKEKLEAETRRSS